MDLKMLGIQFIEWTKKKIRHHSDSNKIKKYFREKEVWWAALGKNIGFEIDGKNHLFERPVLIIKQYTENVCFVLPITTKIKSPLPWYQVLINIESSNKENAVIINQGRTISSARFLRKYDVAKTDNYNEIMDKFANQFNKKASRR